MNYLLSVKVWSAAGTIHDVEADVSELTLRSCLAEPRVMPA